MKKYFDDLIPKIQRYSKRLDDLTLLTNQHWVFIGDVEKTKQVFIFRSNNELLISENGIVEIGSWDYLGNQSLIIKTNKANYLLKYCFFDENIIALKPDSTNGYIFFINESKHNNELNTQAEVLNFLKKKYIINHGITDFEINYKILEEIEFKTFFSKKIIYKIKFSDGSQGLIYRDLKREIFFYQNYLGEDVYDSNFDKTVKEMYSDKKKHIH